MSSKCPHFPHPYIQTTGRECCHPSHLENNGTGFSTTIRQALGGISSSCGLSLWELLDLRIVTIFDAKTIAPWTPDFTAFLCGFVFVQHQRGQAMMLAIEVWGCIWRFRFPSKLVIGVEVKARILPL